ncbi:A disintegrin and metallo ase with thrombospondin motifs 18, putative [Babesia ovata]|uniref:A disintegrin and metallo ase with thrombospondin motifs 18, putative n=1 Tax=Babesia ovata TaxID=189622 RepID=A0A2H6KB11_9APIC|nr:A disintegrin and metallo ase with thrombospondin motifs 18, putative [Babesia ovata]GBE60183.1 A disintegrin and metallo ase with thrombospondin motifs 18, putative [Babesia ovata]
MERLQLHPRVECLEVQVARVAGGGQVHHVRDDLQHRQKTVVQGGDQLGRRLKGVVGRNVTEVDIVVYPTTGQTVQFYVLRRQDELLGVCRAEHKLQHGLLHSGIDAQQVVTQNKLLGGIAIGSVGLNAASTASIAHAHEPVELALSHEFASSGHTVHDLAEHSGQRVQVRLKLSGGRQQSAVFHHHHEPTDHLRERLGQDLGPQHFTLAVELLKPRNHP